LSLRRKDDALLPLRFKKKERCRFFCKNCGRDYSLSEFLTERAFLSSIEAWKFGELLRLSDCIGEESFRLGQHVFVKGAPAKHVYFIRSGESHRLHRRLVESRRRVAASSRRLSLSRRLVVVAPSRRHVVTPSRRPLVSSSWRLVVASSRRLVVALSRRRAGSPRLVVSREPSWRTVVLWAA
jgi:hypothetical protein